MTYEQAKDQIARDWGLIDFKALERQGRPTENMMKFAERVAQLYADSVAREAVNEAWKQFSPRPIDVKSGWNNNAKILEEIVTDINNEIYVEDENEMMEYIDHALVSIKKRFLEYQPKP